MDKVYADTVRLLLKVAPDVFANDIFAMKGGTAINLFVMDMPRLSVDIDVVYPMALTDTKLKNLKPTDKVYKVVDRDGMYVVVSLKGTLTFRYDYRLAGRRETLTLGQYDEFQASQPKRPPEDIKYGDPLSLADARDLLARAKNMVSRGESPARVKSEAKKECQESGMRDGFGRCSELLHSAAAALNRPLPRPETLTAEIDTLAAWADSLRQRQGAARLP